MSASFLDGRVIMHRGDCLAVMAEMPPDSVDAVVCDPPYHLTSIVKRFGSETAAPPKSGAATGVYKRTAAGFMGKQWDGGDVAFRPETWAAVLRVLKPGGHLLAFGGTRTYHRLACAIEDAGFEIRDQVGWLFGSGFPKSHDVSKAIDKAAGAEREVAARKKKLQSYGFVGNNVYGNGPEKDGVQLITAPATDDARRWQGWGTALKPAHEPICMARKPLSERTVAANVLKWGVGGLNIDGCRVEGQPKAFGNGTGRHGGQLAGGGENSHERGIWESQQGRWPANLLHDGSDEVVGLFPETSSGTSSGHRNEPKTNGIYGKFALQNERGHVGDSGSAARFFYRVEKDVLCDLCCLPLNDENGKNHPCNANNVDQVSRTASTLIGASVHCDAAASPAPENADRSHPLNGSAISVENPTPQCLPPEADIAQKNALPPDVLRIAQNVRSAANLCSLCATDIARALVAVRQVPSGESLRFQDFISGRNAQILSQQLALYVAGREDTDIILTTPSLKQLFGSVFHAIEKNTAVREASQNRAPEKSKRFWYGSKAASSDRAASRHPTVKPIALIRYLCRLITPPGGTILDCFAGTGTTGEAAFLEGFNAVLIEREAEYQADIRRRMALVMAGPDEKAAAMVKAKGRAASAGPLFDEAAQ